ncbi:MAG TPA: hypothetical protein PLU15_09945 [Bacillota bacterium]|nr:hypothetical protein [Bacillota bacterium]
MLVRLSEIRLLVLNKWKAAPPNSIESCDILEIIDSSVWLKTHIEYGGKQEILLCVAPRSYSINRGLAGTTGFFAPERVDGF